MKKFKIFSGIDEKETEKLLKRIGAYVKKYRKDEYILMAGQRAEAVCLVSYGSVNIIKEDIFGERHILTHMGEGSMFGESYAFSANADMQVSAVAAQDCKIIFIKAEKIIDISSPDDARLILLKNVIAAIAGQNIRLTGKIEHLSRRSIREKVMSYLSDESAAGSGNEIIIPYNRQELADYLAVDRSALSAELGRMRDDGLIEFERNRFTICR